MPNDLVFGLAVQMNKVVNDLKLYCGWGGGSDCKQDVYLRSPLLFSDRGERAQVGLLVIAFHEKRELYEKKMFVMYVEH